MAENSGTSTSRERGNSKTHHPHNKQRAAYDPNRPNYNKAYYNFGVRDLRELLDKKHEEQQANSGPPPDPSFNYLRDPLRDNSQSQDNEQNTPRKPFNKDNHRSEIRRSYRGRSRGGNNSNTRPQSGPSKTISNPINIKVEFTTTTGEHKYTLDESTILPDLKHTPEKHVGKKPFRGRGRGRGYRGNRGRGAGYKSRDVGSSKNETVATEKSVENVLEGENWDEEGDVEGEGDEYGNGSLQEVETTDNSEEVLEDEVVAAEVKGNENISTETEENENISTETKKDENISAETKKDENIVTEMKEDENIVVEVVQENEKENDAAAGEVDKVILSVEESELKTE